MGSCRSGSEKDRRQRRQFAKVSGLVLRRRGTELAEPPRLMKPQLRRSRPSRVNFRPQQQRQPTSEPAIDTRASMAFLDLPTSQIVRALNIGFNKTDNFETLVRTALLNSRLRTDCIRLVVRDNA